MERISEFEFKKLKWILKQYIPKIKKEDMRIRIASLFYEDGEDKCLYKKLKGWNDDNQHNLVLLMVSCTYKTTEIIMSIWEDDLELIIVDETKGLDYCNSNMVGNQDESALRSYALDILGSMKHDDPIESIVQIFSLDIHK
jgi:hypothetical protein